MINQKDRFELVTFAIDKAFRDNYTVYQLYRMLHEAFLKHQIMSTRTIRFEDQDGYEVTAHDDIIFALMTGLMDKIVLADNHGYNFADIPMGDLHKTLDDRNRLFTQRAIIDGVMYYDFNVDRTIGQPWDIEDVKNEAHDDDLMIYQYINGQFISLFYQEANQEETLKKRDDYIKSWRRY